MQLVQIPELRMLEVVSDLSRPQVCLDTDLERLEAPEGGSKTVFDGGGTSPTTPGLNRLADKLLASKKAYDQQLGRMLKAVAKGEPFAQAGERNDALYKMICRIVQYWQTCDPEQTANLFAPSLVMMGSDAPTLQQAADMIRRQIDQEIRNRGSRISAAFRSDRTTPYTNDELIFIAERIGCSPSELRRRWVIQKAKSYYVLGPFGYTRCSVDEVSVAALTILAPAMTAQVDPQVATEKGVRLKTPAELVRDYGMVAEHIEIDLCAQVTRYDAERGVMIEAPCPIRVKAKFDANIDRWLRELAGEKYPQLEQWLASITRLDRPAAALYLEGPPGVGKSLLGNGLARIFTTRRPTSLNELFEGFNDGMLECPIVFADEVTPDRVRDSRMTSKIREAIQARSRSLNRKFMPVATLFGAQRIILAANNLRLIKTAENLTNNDIHAINERFFFIEVPGAESGKEDDPAPARVFLESLPKGEPESWVHEDKLAMHVMWLVENVKVESQGRFVVAGGASKLTRVLLTQSGTRPRVCEWITNALLNAKPVMGHPVHKHHFRVVNGELLINAKAITELWETYVFNDKNPPGPNQVSADLSALSTRRQALWCPELKKVIQYRVVNLDLVREWAEETQYSDADTLVNCILKLNTEAAA